MTIAKPIQVKKGDPKNILGTNQYVYAYQNIHKAYNPVEQTALRRLLSSMEHLTNKEFCFSQSPSHPLYTSEQTKAFMMGENPAFTMVLSSLLQER